MQALAQEEDVGGLFRLGREEVVLLEGQAAAEIVQGGALGLVELVVRDVLYDEV